MIPKEVSDIMSEQKYMELIEKVKMKIMCHELTGVAMERGCTDGYDTKFTFLAMDIVDKILKEVIELKR